MIKLYLFLALLLCACTSVNKENRCLIYLDEIPPKVSVAPNISSALESYRFIPLETKTESLLSDIWKIIKRDNKFYISTFFDKKFYVFDQLGRFITKMDRTGGGPGEYISMNDFDVFGNVIVILDGAKMKFYRNDEKMEFIKSVELSVVPSNIKCISETLFCIYPVRETESFYIVNEKGGILNKGFPSNRATKIGAASKFIKIDDNHFIVQYGFSNDLVEYNTKENKFYNFSICPKGLILDSQKEEEYLTLYPRGYLSHTDIFVARQPYATKDNVLIPFQKGRELVYCIADKNGKMLHCINKHTQDDLLFGNSVSFFSGVKSDSEDSFLSDLSPAQILEVIQRNKGQKGSSSYDKLVECFGNGKLNENDNPVLVEFKF